MRPINVIEIIMLAIVGLMMIVLPLIFIYKYGKQKGRLQEMERQMREKIGGIVGK
jgi:hypothetical protein